MYDPNKAAKYWGARIKNFDLEHAVLSLNTPSYLNDAYSIWEYQTLLSNLEKIKNSKIVDIACGGGRISIPLAKKGAKVTGIDITQEMLDFAKKNAQKNHCSANLTLVKASAWDTRLPSNNFDKVLLLGILEHLPNNFKKKTIKEAYRLCKNNGKIFIVINNKNSFFLSEVKKWKKPFQKKSGYYSSLMEPKKITNYLKTLKLETKIVNSNLNYSILYHYLNSFDQNTLSSKKLQKLSSLFDYYIQLDLNQQIRKYFNKKYSDIENSFADQFFIVATK
jgi:2-polyprenyl-3-methyl-5-hydroxy-6-metoxy-1,4-benzoquinol methylase